MAAAATQAHEDHQERTFAPTVRCSGIIPCPGERFKVAVRYLIELCRV